MNLLYHYSGVMSRYRAVRVPITHPLANMNASYQAGPGTVQIWTHRAVLFDKIGYGPHLCHWCSVVVNWTVGNERGLGKRLVSDHLDGTTTNNDPENLVPSCDRCNVARGHTDEWAVRPDELFVTGSNGRRTRATERICPSCGKLFLMFNARAREIGGPERCCSRSCAGRLRQAHLRAARAAR